MWPWLDTLVSWHPCIMTNWNRSDEKHLADSRDNSMIWGCAPMAHSPNFCAPFPEISAICILNMYNAPNITYVISMCNFRAFDINVFILRLTLMWAPKARAKINTAFYQKGTMKHLKEKSASRKKISSSKDADISRMCHFANQNAL